MTILRISIFAAGGALLLGAPAQAATDYFLKLGDIKGESTASNKDHKGWIEIESMQFAGDSSSAAGGVAAAPRDPASGQAARSARDAASGQATGKRQHLPVRAGGETNGSSPAAAGQVSAGQDEGEAALLLPAVQRVRTMVTDRPEGFACKVGAAFELVEIRKGKDGPVGRITDATVSACTSDSVSFNFAKIEY